MNKLHTFAGCCALALAMSSPLFAATFQGTSTDITDFTNGSEVSTRGTLVDAVNLINDDQGTPDVTINGVLFKGIAPGQFHEAGESFAEASFVYHGGDGYQDVNLWTSGGAYDLLADSQLYGVDKGEINYGDGFGVVNLTPGTRYELQIFMLDDRADVTKSFPLQFQQVTFTGNVDEYVPYDPAPADLGYMEGITIGGAGVTHANGEIATIRFSIDEGFNGIFVNTWNAGAFNGMQLRLLGLPGDYNGDNAVDAADYNVWKSAFGSTSQLAADGSGNGIVDAADYTIWRDSAASGSGSLVAAGVPEPGTMLLVMTCLTLGAAVGRARGEHRRCAIAL
ncbi:MAG: dockerin type I domain-containing protein [Pirellulales bacterium]